MAGFASELGGAVDLRVSDIMTPNPVTITPDSSVVMAARLMKERSIGSLIVVDGDGNLVGVITLRDIVYKVVAEGRNPEEVKVSEAMSINPYYVLANDPVERAVEIMGDAGIGHLPVLDPETFRVIGVVSKSDVVRHAPHLLARLYAARGVV